MTWNTWKTTYRFMATNRTFTIINLTGLTAGLTVSFFLLVYIINEFSYNNFPQDSHRIYRILTKTEESTIAFSPLRLAPMIRQQTTGVLSSGSLIFLPFLTGPVSVRQTDGYAHETNVVCADPEMLKMLTLPVLHGSNTNNPDTNQIMLSESAAKACFGKSDAIGKKLELIIAGLRLNLTVSAVYTDLPWNSTIKMDYILGMDHFFAIMSWLDLDIGHEMASCTDLYAESYLLTDNSFEEENLNRTMPVIMDSLNLSDQHITFMLQSIRGIYLSPIPVSNDIHAKGNQKSLLYYGSLAIFVLLIAGINYTILSTARAAMRYKEFGIRKILGAGIAPLRKQILLESMTLTFLAFPLTFLVLGILEPFLDFLMGYDVRLYTRNILIYIPLFAGITLFIGCVSGWYIAVYLSSLHPLKAIQNKLMLRKRFNSTRIFISFQLFITLSLLICVIIIFKQLHFCLHKEVRIDAENLVVVPFTPGEFTQYPALRDALLTHECIVSVSGSSNPPPSTSTVFTTINTTDTIGEPVNLETYAIDAGYFSTLGIPLVWGTDIPSSLRDRTDPFPILFNEAAFSALGMDRASVNATSTNAVIGVVSDFHIHSLYSPIRPAIYRIRPDDCNALIIRHHSEKRSETLVALRKAWHTLAPDLLLSYYTYPEALRQLYGKERAFGQIILSFAILAFIITGMGLFGLAILIAERSTKSIAIRKIYGASATDILFRMQKEFMGYLAIATLLAIPATWLLMHYWLSAFYYKTSMRWYLFAGAVVAVALFVSLIMFSRSYHLLRKPPVRALKYE